MKYLHTYSYLYNRWVASQNCWVHKILALRHSFPTCFMKHSPYTGFSQNAPFFGDVLDKWKSLRLKLVLHLRSGNLSNLQRATGGVDVSFAVGNRQAQVSPKKQVLVEPKNVIFQKDCLIFLMFVFYFHVDIIILAWCSSISFAIDNDLSRQYGALAMGIQGIAKCLGLEKQSECYQSVTSGKNNHFQFLYIGPLKHHISNKHVFSVVLTDFFF